MPILAAHDEIILKVDEGHREGTTDWLMRCMAEAIKEVTGDSETPMVVKSRRGSRGEGEREHHSERRPHEDKRS